jgi:hypothetical protein
MEEMKNKGQVYYTKSKGSKGTSSVGYPPRIEDCGCKGQMPFKIQKKNSKTNFQG